MIQKGEKWINWTYIKIKNFSKSNKMLKSEATNWKTIFKNHIYGKGLPSRIYEEFSKLNTKKTYISTLKMGRNFEQALHQRRYSDDKYMHENHLTSLVTRKMNIKNMKLLLCIS